MDKKSLGKKKKKSIPEGVVLHLKAGGQGMFIYTRKKGWECVSNGNLTRARLCVGI